MRAIDLTGDVYGRLTVLHEDLPRTTKERYWICKCECGNLTRVAQSNLRRSKGSKTTSCGCYRKEHIAAKNVENTKHGMCSHPLYITYSCMIGRCYRPNDIAYKYYGGRGITVCDEWKNNAKAFLDWGLANGWKEGLTIDRIDSNKGYFPENCRFATMKQQAETRNARYTFTPRN